MKRRLVKQRAVKCPTCKKVRTSIWEPSMCNHDQEEEGIPLPLAKCSDLQSEIVRDFENNKGEKTW